MTNESRVDLLTNSGKVLNFYYGPELPAGNIGSIICGLHKSGSTLLDKICWEIAEAAGMPLVAIPIDAFTCSILEEDWQETFSINDYINTKRHYIGWRSLPRFLRFRSDLSGMPLLLLIRDPRDALVSWYYSLRKSHPLPAEGELLDNISGLRRQFAESNIDDFVLVFSDQLRREWESYIDCDWFMGNAKIYRYEDVIFSPKSFVTDVSRILVGPAVTEAEVIDKICKKNFILPKAERTDNHVRKVTPGDHLEKLRPETIKILNARFDRILRLGSYC